MRKIRSLALAALLAAPTAAWAQATLQPPPSYAWNALPPISSSRGFFTSMQFLSGPVSTQTGAYTFASTDCGTTVSDVGATAAHTYTVPTTLPVGCRIDVFQLTSNALTVAAASGETLGVPSGYSATLASQYSHARVDILTSTLADMHP